MSLDADRTSVGALASKGIFWSIVQTWSSRLITFVIFVVLARFLTPAQYGIASAAAICLLFIGTIAELGFGDAIVQRRELSPSEINLPFFVSLALSVVLAGTAALTARQIEAIMRAPNVAPLIVALAGVAPLTTISLFQEFNYRRHLAFRSLATRVLVANGTAGIVAICAAYLGAGVWSLVVQNYLTVLIGLIWLWRKPYWTPTRQLRWPAFRQLARFGSAVVGLRIIDFTATRLVDVMIVWRFGIGMLGIYSVGSRLYLTLLQLLQGALNDVSLSVLSRISHDRERIGAVYLQAIVLAGFVGAPIFTLCAALSHEICAFVFGARWTGVDRISQPLLLIGAVQCIQFLNGPYLSARGRPATTLVIGLVKYAAMIVGLLSLRGTDVVAMVGIFAALQLSATPLSFYAISKELGVPLRRIVGALWPSIAANAIGFAAVTIARPHLPAGLNVVLAAMMLGALFATCFGSLAIGLGYPQVRTVIRFVEARIGTRRGSRPATISV